MTPSPLYPPHSSDECERLVAVERDRALTAEAAIERLFDTKLELITQELGLMRWLLKLVGGAMVTGIAVALLKLVAGAIK